MWNDIWEIIGLQLVMLGIRVMSGDTKRATLKALKLITASEPVQVTRPSWYTETEIRPPEFIGPLKPPEWKGPPGHTWTATKRGMVCINCLRPLTAANEECL